MIPHRARRLLSELWTVILLGLAGCATHPALDESRALNAQGRIEEGLARLEQASRDAPQDRQLRAQYFLQRDLGSAQWLLAAESLRAARDADGARALYERVLRIDPGNARARDGLEALRMERDQAQSLADAIALIERGDTHAAEAALRRIVPSSPSYAQARVLLRQLRDRAEALPPPAPPPAGLRRQVTLEFRDMPMKTVFEVIARTSGLNFVFDKDVRTDIKVNIFVRETTVDELVRLILATNQLERKVLNENSLLVYPDTPAKARLFQDLVTRSFYLANTDAKQALALVKAMVKTRDTFIDERLNLLVIKDTPEAVRLAERLLESLDMPEPEVMLEVEVLEVSRSKLQELGLRFPEQIGYGQLQPPGNTTIVNSGVTQTNPVPGGALAAGYIDLHNRAGLTSYAANPLLMLNLRSQGGDGNLLANPRIRVRNRDKAKVHIGDRVPVFTTTSTANVGVAASIAYLDIGLKLDVEPNVYLDDDVSIKVGLEVSSIVKEVTGPAGSLGYQVGTRSATTSLRLKNGETQVLAGLISDEERSTTHRLPGLGDIPGIGRLFSSRSDNTSKTEIVLLITPRVLRNLARPDTTPAAIPAGTEQGVGVAPLRVPRAAPRSLSMSTTPGAVARVQAQAEPAPASEAEPAPAPPGPAPAPVPAPAPAPAPTPGAPAASPAVPAPTP